MWKTMSSNPIPRSVLSFAVFASSQSKYFTPSGWLRRLAHDSRLPARIAKQLGENTKRPSEQPEHHCPPVATSDQHVVLAAKPGEEEHGVHGRIDALPSHSTEHEGDWEEAKVRLTAIPAVFVSPRRCAGIVDSWFTH
jgi:hypothetical protein